MSYLSMASPHKVVATETYMKNEIIKLREQGKSYSEISKITGKSISTIRYQCSPHQRQCAQLRKSKHRAKNLLKLKMLFGGKCQVCGYNRCFNNLSFHHVDPSTKNKKFDSMSAFLRHSSFQKTYEETQKCVLICANCHGEVHAGLIPCPKVFSPALVATPSLMLPASPVLRPASTCG